MDERDNFPLTDPASALLGLGALCGLIAAHYWYKVFRSVDTSGHAITGPNREYLASAAMFTAFALALACFGYLLGRFSGRF